METAKVKIIAVIAAVVTAALAFYYLRQVNESKPVETTVLQAATNIPSGAKITEDMLTKATVYEPDVIPAAATSTDQLIGMYADTNIYAGEQISTQKVTDQSASSNVTSFSYKIPKGMRTVTISIDPTTSVAGMLQVGDHVDIIATYTKQGTAKDANGNPTDGGTVTRFIADNIEIAALDQTIVRNTDDEDGSSNEQTFTTVTMFVTPELAKALVWENQNGSVVLTLRSPNEDEDPDHAEFTARSMNDF